MTEIRLHNTLTGQTEPFVPQNPGEVRMYTCGPTVYDYAHIGNYRTFVFQDILRRFLKLRGFRLNHVMNLTDVDDRIITNAAAAGVSIRDYTQKFAQAFFDDCKALSIESPEHWIRATDHIDSMVQLIQRLQEKTYTYASEGSIYYRIAKFPNYGKLSKIDITGIQAGARVDVDRYEKERDRKSTRLNSSHLVISYAVFCLKKKMLHPLYGLRLIRVGHPRPSRRDFRGRSLDTVEGRVRLGPRAEVPGPQRVSSIPRHCPAP